MTKQPKLDAVLNLNRSKETMGFLQFSSRCSLFFSVPFNLFIFFAEAKGFLFLIIARDKQHEQRWQRPTGN